jgi:hypothetical protein
MGSYAVNQRMDIWADRIVWFSLTVGVLGLLLVTLVAATNGLGERSYQPSAVSSPAAVEAARVSLPPASAVDAKTVPASGSGE